MEQLTIESSTHPPLPVHPVCAVPLPHYVQLLESDDDTAHELTERRPSPHTEYRFGGAFDCGPRIACERHGKVKESWLRPPGWSGPTLASSATLDLHEEVGQYHG